VKLSIGKDFWLPVDAVTHTFGILAQRGVGKTYTAAVMTEEMLQARQTVVVVDPIGVWWGLRAAADGKQEGLPILVFGGDHGDVALDAAAGELIADTVVDQRISAVLDLSLMRKGESQRFMTEFAERLYHKNRAPVHLVLDEADAWAPQNPLPGAQRLLGAIEDLVRRGRARGIGVSLITQRAAVLNKNVLTQIDVLVALRLTAPQDRKAIDEWINVNASADQRKVLMESLASLPIGTAWFWSPGWLQVFERVAVRKRLTFDSSATPKPGATVTAPAKLARVEIEQLGQRISALVERAKAEDPKELKRRIAELEREAKKQQPVVDVAAVSRAAFSSGYAQAVKDAQAVWVKATSHPALPVPIAVSGPAPTPPRPAPPPQSARPRTDSKLPKAERLILSALAPYDSRTKTQVALLAGYASTGGGFNNALGSLRAKGFVEGGGDGLRATAAGLAELGPYDPLPTGRDLLRHWLQQQPLLGKAERSILQALGDRSPRSKEDLATASGYEPTGGGFNNALGRLRTLELIAGSRDAISLAEELR